MLEFGEFHIRSGLSPSDQRGFSFFFRKQLCGTKGFSIFKEIFSSSKMKAAIYTSYGPPSVLKVTTLEKPTPKANELLIKVYATTVTAGDIRLRASDFPPLFWLPARLIFGLFKPKKQTLGHEFAGVVEAVGTKVSKLAVGDEVFGTTTMLRTGSYAEYVCIPASWKSGVVAKKPVNLSLRSQRPCQLEG